MIQTDVLVIGLGPAGASAARVAAEAGRSVIAVEKSTEVGHPVQCAEFVPNPMGKYAKEDGVLYQSVAGMKSFLPSGHREDSSFPGLMIDRAAFDQAIAAKAQQGGADLWLGARFETLDQKNNIARIRRADENLDVAYKVLIAGDGPHSPVAQALGLPKLKTVSTRQYTVPLLKDYEDTDIWLSDDFPGGYAWLFPKNDLANLGLGADKRWEENLKQPLDELHQKLRSEGLVGEKILYRTGGAIPVGGLRDQLFIGNVLLTGDAAGLTHPITGAGISAGVISGERAGEAADDWLHGDEDAFDDFEEDVRDQFEHTVERGVERRLELEQVWRTQNAQEDSVMRKGWIAFDEYFGSGPRQQISL